jgi:hypothetical protein
MILLSSSSSVLVKQSTILIKLNNEVKLVNKYDNITLVCPVDTNEVKMTGGDRPTQLIKWFKNDENLKLFNKNKIRVINNNCLSIRNFNVYDIGLYKCQIINGNGAIQVHNVTLRVNLTSKEINELLFNYDASADKDEMSDEDEDDEVDYIDNNLNTYDYYSRGGGKFFFLFLFNLYWFKISSF